MSLVDRYSFIMFLVPLFPGDGENGDTISLEWAGVDGDGDDGLMETNWVWQFFQLFLCFAHS